jgi:hypothetical protein
MAKAKDPLMQPAVPVDGPGTPPAPEGTKAPPFGTPRAAEPKGEFPRVCSELERVPVGSGLVRYKVRVRNYTGFDAPKYILAQKGDRAGAKAVYLDASGIDAHVTALKESGVEANDLVAPLWVISELED